MKNTISIILIAIILQSCSSVKVMSAWKAEQKDVDEFKKKNILVIARTANNQARLAFEIAIADQLRAKGINATESFKKAPNMNANREITEERVNLMKSLLNSEGFDGIVITVIKDKKETTYTSTSGISFGASYSNYYPGYYGSFYNYYSSPYAYGSYYNSFGGYIPTSTSTHTSTTYVLETIAYNLDSKSEQQIVAIITSNLDDPKDAYKTADKYVIEIMKSLE
jgi:hypothetical protein